MDKFSKRVAPRTVSIDEVADNFTDLLRECVIPVTDPDDASDSGFVLMS